MHVSLTKKIVFILFSLHVIFLIYLYFTQNSFLMPDTPRYVALADALREGHFGITKAWGYEAESLRLPGYPFFILICQTLFGSSQSAVVIPQIVLYLLAVWFTYKAVQWNFGENTGVIFMALSLFYPVIAFDAIFMLPNLTSLFFISTAVFAISKPSWRASLWSFVIAGISLGCASYQRTNLFPLAFIFSIIIFVRFRNLRTGALLLAGICALIFFSWSLRNYLVFGSFSPSSNNVGLESMIYQGTLESRYAAEQKVFFRRNEFQGEYEEFKSDALQNQLVEIKRTVGLKDDDIYFRILDLPHDRIPEAKKILMVKARENIAAEPLHFVTIGLATILRMWISKADEIPTGYYSPPESVRMLFGGIVFLLAVLSGIFVYQTKEANEKFLGLLCLGTFIFFSLSLSFLHSEVRYANPGKLLFLALSAYSFICLFKLLNTFRVNTSRVSERQPA